MAKNYQKLRKKNIGNKRIRRKLTSIMLENNFRKIKIIIMKKKNRFADRTNMLGTRFNECKLGVKMKNIKKFG